MRRREFAVGRPRRNRSQTLFPATIALTLRQRHSAKLCPCRGLADRSGRVRAFRQNNLRTGGIIHADKLGAKKRINWSLEIVGFAARP